MMTTTSLASSFFRLIKRKATACCSLNLVSAVSALQWRSVRLYDTSANAFGRAKVMNSRAAPVKLERLSVPCPTSV